MRWKCGEFEFGEGCAPVVMGILNVTPDSFSDGGEHLGLDAALAQARVMLSQGADIIDVGGESTRPGSQGVEVEEETRRVLPVVEALAREGVCVSVDTRHPQVAKACLDAGASIVNDISGFEDPDMRQLAAQTGCGCVVMHMQGEPSTMQQAPEYRDVAGEVEEYLLSQAAALEECGVARECIMLDPGFGFGKTVEHNLALLEAIPRLNAHGYPVMAAVSRKSFIGTLCGIDEARLRDKASALCAAAACDDGAFAVRAHNVAATQEALRNAKRAVVALGSNMENPSDQLNRAVAAMRGVEGLWVTRVSSYVTSEPAYKEDQDVFVNAVALVKTLLEPNALLDALHVIENAQGRVRHEANGPRTLDLDIVDYQGVVSSDPVLTLPHPRALERDFVVTPLLEVAPGYVLANGSPVTRDTITCGRVI